MASRGPLLEEDSRPPHRLVRAFARHAWWVLLSGALAALLLAREKGWVELDRCQFQEKLIVNIAGRAETERPVSDLTRHDLAAAGGAEADEAFMRGMLERMDPLQGIPPEAYAADLKVEVLSAEWKGNLWRPWKKEGSVKVKVAVSGLLSHPRKALETTVRYDAEVAFKAEGPCAVYSLKRKAGRVVGDAINADLSARLLRSE